MWDASQQTDSALLKLRGRAPSLAGDLQTGASGTWAITTSALLAAFPYFP